MAEQKRVITFSEGAAADGIWLQLDEAMNQGASRFAYGTKGYYQVFTCPDGLPLGFALSDGKNSSEGNGTLEVEEFVNFIETDKGSTRLPIFKITETKWLGRSLGGVAALGGTSIKAAKSGKAAVLKIRYLAKFRRFAVYLRSRDEAEYPVLVAANRSVSLTLNFYPLESDLGGWTPYWMKVVDQCTGDPNEGAEVFLDGVSMGTAPEDGNVYFGLLQVGSEHTVRAVKEGCREAVATFTVPPPQSEDEDGCPET